MERAEKIPIPYNLLLLLSASVLIFAYIRWEDVVIQNPDGSYSIDDATSDKIADRVDRIEHKTVFYQLVAASNGYFICPLCPPEASSNNQYFLNYKEVYKYGITMAENHRYSQAELARWNLRYEQIAIGNYTEMLILETTFMAEYPLYPDNLRRPIKRRLITPPGSGTRLR
ncbi:hypothetical protein [Flavilitoribacter nigricans]|uniref:Uncharacterized protein n=1 Tax=Flavilitoribacter nigricans (strain ATCC 23147 / DSM 23189 / NBRC 102662 / NCIMB 1420 / SS-2) TaxID=1122177 RepID=A0A2D0NE25_FLAN2|nr:hypothetical protein [Flavilitoribacter nigricans]PHN06774.1 hypothetical protein CRP01_10815 [Flavilitoribacter nigricans DSM 23189 = NBRC 102662]